MVAFLRSHSQVQEQTGTKATKKQSPERPSVLVTKEEPVTSTRTREPRTGDKLEEKPEATVEDKMEDKLQPRTPGMEGRHHHFFREEKIAPCGGACF